MMSSLALPINNLSVQLVHLLSNEHTENVVISPLSISMAMSMVMLGARNETEKQLFHGLNFNQTFNSSDLAHNHFKDLLNQTKFTESSEDLQLKIANYLLINQDSSSQVAEYTKEVADQYQAKVESVNFQVDGSKIQENVNTWVSNETNHKIPTMMDEPPNPDTFAILLNAVYFKGRWSNPFERVDTRNGTFFNQGTQKVTVSMMHKSQERFDITVNVTVGGQKVKIISLPYMKGLDMIVVLPDDKEGLKKMTNLKFEDLNIELNGMRTNHVNLSLPTFRIETSKELKSPLSSLGIRDVFTTNSDLRGINGKNDLIVSSVTHKTFIEVNEEGTEAAAATGIGLRLMCLIKSIDFVVDHPFLFFIRDKTTGVFLFSGAVNEL